MKFKPLGDRVLALPAPKETQSAGGIIIPDTAGERERQSRQVHVVAVGDGVRLVKVDDQIIIGKYIGQDVNLEDVDFLIIPEDDVMGVVE